MMTDPKALLDSCRGAPNDDDHEEEVRRFLRMSVNDRHELIYRVLCTLTQRFLNVESSVAPEGAGAKGSRPGPTLQ